MKSVAEKTAILIETLPYIQKFEHTTFVIKYGGAAMIDDRLNQSFARDVTLLKKIGINIVIVHGGGKEVTETAKALGIESKFIHGQRYTDEAMMSVVQMVLAGKTNKEIVARINQQKGNAIGLCGVDGNLLLAQKSTPNGTDLGLVGEIIEVQKQLISLFLSNDLMPIIAPIGVDEIGQSYNINADIVAAAVASAIQAEKLVYLSDVEGLMSEGELIHSITQPQAEELIKRGTIDGGMIPKIQSAFKALKAGVKKVHMIDGRIEHSLLLEIFTDEGIGTEVVHQ